LLRLAKRRDHDDRSTTAPHHRPPSAPSWPGLVVLAFLSFAVACVLLWPQHGRALGWDEVDYAKAAKLGPEKNLLESGSLSPRDYLRFARAKLSHAKPQLPSRYNEQSDPLLLRHYHPPAVPVAMAVSSGFGGDRATRFVQLVGAAALIVVGLWCYTVTSPRRSLVAAVPLVLALAWVGWHLFGDLEMHGWETVFISLVGLCLVQWIKTGQRRSWGVALCGALALAILTLESGLFLLVPVTLCVVLSARTAGVRSPLAWLRCYLLPGALLVFALVVVAWPGAVLKVSAMKTPLFFAYLIRRKETFTSNDAGVGSWVVIVPALVVLAAGIHLLVARRDELGRWGPWALIGLVYWALLFPFALGTRFLLPAIAPLFVLVAYAIDSVPRRWGVTLSVVLLALVVGGLVANVRANDRSTRDDATWRSDLAFVRDEVTGTPSLLDGGHIYRYYLGDGAIEDLWLSFRQTSLLLRERGEYRALTDGDLAGKYVGVLRSRTGFLDSEAGHQLERRCGLLVRPTVWLWDCRSGGGTRG
jgi:hypothetical protein